MAKQAPSKPGVRSSEFWLTLVAVATNAVIASDVIAPASAASKALAAVSAALASLGYVWSRTTLKK